MVVSKRIGQLQMGIPSPGRAKKMGTEWHYIKLLAIYHNRNFIEAWYTTRRSMDKGTKQSLLGEISACLWAHWKWKLSLGIKKVQGITMVESCNRIIEMVWEYIRILPSMQRPIWLEPLRIEMSSGLSWNHNWGSGTHAGRGGTCTRTVQQSDPEAMDSGTGSIQDIQKNTWNQRFLNLCHIL